MLLGLAIGDALGNTSEGMTPDERRRRYGVIRDYLPNRHAGWRAVGLPSDDSQLALWTLEQLNADRRFIPEHLAQRFAHQEIYGIGKTVRQFLVNYKDRGLPWYESGVPSAGNGALMRIAPLVIPYVRRPRSLLWVDTILAAAITHNDAASTASCAAFVAMLWDLLGMDRARAPEWWLERFVAVAWELETGKPYRPRGGRFQGDVGPLWQFVEHRVGEACGNNLTVQEACDSWHSAAYLLETMPSVLYILMRHGEILMRPSRLRSTTPTTTTRSPRWWVQPWVPCTARRRCQLIGDPVSWVAWARPTTAGSRRCSTKPVRSGSNQDHRVRNSTLSLQGVRVTWQSSVRPLAEEVMATRSVPGLILARSCSIGSPEFLVLGSDSDGRPLAADSLFPVASLTKLATALAVLRLAAQGLDLDEPLTRTLPDAAAA